MLKQLRQKKTMKRILWVLALIIIPAFVLWGAGGLRESRNYAGVIFGKRVTFDEYRDSFNAVTNRALMTYGSALYQMQDKINLEEEAWDHLIMLKEAKGKKIKVSDEEVIARVASLPFFQDKDGSFSQKAYELILNNTFRTDPRKFEEEIRQSLMIEKLIRNVIQHVKPSDLETEEAMAKRLETFQNWRQDLYRRAGLISYIPKEEIQEEKED